MEIIITDTRRAVFTALQAMFANFQIPASRQVTIRVVHGDVAAWDAPNTCFVNGGNCVGDMSGKLDATLLRLVPGAEADVALALSAHGDVSHHGAARHFPLFSALMSPGEDSRWLLTAPCMYVGGPRDLRGTRNAFHATHTALSQLYTALRSGVVLHRVVMTGMCSGHGRTNREVMAKQMLEAFRLVFVSDRMVVDATQAAHPRLMLNRQYSVQPVCGAHADFQPRNRIEVSAGGEHSRRDVCAQDFEPPAVRSGGSQEPSPFANVLLR